MPNVFVYVIKSYVAKRRKKKVNMQYMSNES